MSRAAGLSAQFRHAAWCGADSARGAAPRARGPRVALGQDLVFVDGTDPAQIDWAVREHSAEAAKIIFVAGSPFNMMKPHQRRFWFDQGGQLTARFGIRHTPAVVTSAGKALQITEVPLGAKGGAS